MSVKSIYCQAPNCNKIRDKNQGSAYCPMHRTRRSRYKSLEIPIRPGLPEGIAMICIHHGERTIDQVYKNGNYKYNRCKECRSESDKKHRLNNPNKKMTRNFIFFGNCIPKLKITIVEYNKIHKKQNGLCKICQRPELLKASNLKHEKPKRLAIDHCHRLAKQGILKIRGLLCQQCNTGIGNLGESIEILKSAIKYLRKSENE